MVDGGQWASEGFIESICEGAVYHVIRWRGITEKLRMATQHMRLSKSFKYGG